MKKIKKIKDFFKRTKNKIKTGALALSGVIGVSAIGGKAHAADPSVGTLLTEVQSNMMSQISSALPVAGTVFAVIAGIFIGVKIFKRLTGARS